MLRPASTRTVPTLGNPPLEEASRQKDEFVRRGSKIQDHDHSHECDQGCKSLDQSCEQVTLNPDMNLPLQELTAD